MFNATKQQLYLEFRQVLKSSKNYTVGMKFVGYTRQTMEGIYAASYLHIQGMERRIIASHFANKHAREAFPCFDEPRFKSTFQLSLAHTFDYDPISNTAIKETLPNGKTMTSKFMITPNMSTSSVAFLISDFKPQKRDYQGISVRVYTPSQFFNKGTFAAETCFDVLDYYNSLNFPLSFQKLDVSFVPSAGYFGSSALNVIFMKPSNILWDKEGSAEGKEITVSSIAHQIAHQYFGNQVTIRYWNESWLMEGISTYLEHRSAGQILKEEIRNFAMGTMRSALHLGSLNYSVALHEDIGRQSEITNVYDMVAYRKGAALIWMLGDFIGNDILQNGLLEVLEENKGEYVSPADIWVIVDKANNVSNSTPANINVSTLMTSWIENKGYPLVTVMRYENHLLITQEPFHSYENDSEENMLWDIPFTLVTDSTPLEYHILQKKTDYLNISKMAWLKANVNQTGFYRVNYDEPTWRVLSGLLEVSPEKLTQFDRAGLIDDALTLARAGKLAVELAFRLLDYLKKERDYQPWKATLGHFHEINMLMQENDELPSVQGYFLSVLDPILQTVDWTKDGTFHEIKLRSTVLAAALENESPDVIKKATGIFKDWMKKNTPISPNLQELIFWAGVKYGGSEEWDFCWEKYLQSVDPREKMLLLLALGKTRDMWRLKRYLRSSLNDSVVSIEDVPLVIASVAENTFGGLIAWEFVEEHWTLLKQMFGRDSIFLSAILTKTTSFFSSEFKYNQVKYFLEGVREDSDPAKQCLETIQANIKWQHGVEKKFISWLRQR